METITSVELEDGFSHETDALDRDGSVTSRENDSEDGGQQGSTPKKRRIVYDKEFLLECFFLPRSRQKPVDFPLPNLGCTLGSIKTVGGSPFTASPAYVAPKRKEENGRMGRERDPDDNISLRPHSGNFAGGCGPNLPLGPREREGMNVGLQQIIDDFRDNHQRTTNLRFANNKRFELANERTIDRGGPRERDLDIMRGQRERELDMRGQRERDMDIRGGQRDRENRDRLDRDQNRGIERDQLRGIERDRDRGERDRGLGRGERDLRDSRDRIGRNGESNQFNHRRPNNSHGQWGADVPERESDWNRRRNRNGSGGSHRDPNPKEKGGYYERRGHYRDREREEEQEPEWFSGGPSSQHETIELRGFTDDERHGDKLKGKDLPPAREHKQPTTNGSLKGPFSDSKAVQQQQEDQQQCDEAGGLDLEKILKMDHIPGILPNGLLDDEDYMSISRSRFNEIFQRNSADAVPKEDKNGKNLLNTLFEARAAGGNSANLTEETESKREITEELGNALRNILLKPSQPKTDKVEQKKHVEQRKPVEPRKNVEQRKPVEQQPPHRQPNVKVHPHPPKTEKQQPVGLNVLQALLEKMIEPGSKTGSGRNSAEGGEPIGFGPPPGLKAPQESKPSALEIMMNSNMPPGNVQFFPVENRPFNILTDDGKVNNPHIREEKFDLTAREENVKIHPHLPQQQQVNPFQVFESLIKQQHPPNTPRDIMAPHQVMAMLPPEIQFLIHHVDVAHELWSQPDCRPLIGALTTGEITFRKLIQDLISPMCNRKPFLAAMVQMILSGNVIVPSLTIIGQPMKFMKPQEPQVAHHMQNHHPNHHEMPTRQPEDGRDMMRRSGTPVSSMPFGMTPTSVMRNMSTDPQTPKAVGSSANNSNSSGPPPPNPASQADFNFLVQQLTNVSNTASTRPQTPLMHPLQFQNMFNANQQHPGFHPQVMADQQRMMMHPNRMVPSQVMNIPHHHDMPQS